MTNLSEIRLLRALIKNKAHWYIKVSCPDTEPFVSVAEKAKGYADKRLTNMLIFFLYRRFLKWDKDNWMVYFTSKVHQQKCYYQSFLSDLVWQLGYESLHGREKDLYAESVNLTIMFI
jgi:hypothetical protein